MTEVNLYISNGYLVANCSTDNMPILNLLASLGLLHLIEPEDLNNAYKIVSKSNSLLIISTNKGGFLSILTKKDN